MKTTLGHLIVSFFRSHLAAHRNCSPKTMQALEQYLKTRPQEQLHRQPLFLNRHGQCLSRFGVRHLVRRYATLAARRCPSLCKRKVTPHTFRHTTALHLIQSRVDIVTVKDWLGHADIKTTSQYVEINLDMKRQALDRCPAPSSVQHNAPLHIAAVM